MNLDIFDSTRHWSYSHNDQIAQASLSALTQQALKDLPSDFNSPSCALHLDFMRKTQLYQALKTLPKGVLQNVFLNCCEDLTFYQKYIANEPNLYVTEDFSNFRIGSVEEAQRYGWMSLKEARKCFKSEEDFIHELASITIFTEEETRQVCKQNTSAWLMFDKKIHKTSYLLYVQHIFKHYVAHALRKFALNGYERVEFRAVLHKLSVYDQKGNLVEKLPEKAFAENFDEVLAEAQKQFPYFTAGFIFCIRKSLDEQQIEKQLQKICELRWDKTIGIDFIDEEDAYGDMMKYDRIVELVLARYPTVRLWKVYHAGETKNHMSRNIEEAVMAGSVRIGHGLNILNRIEFLPFCKQVCFEKCPMSNLLLGYCGDPRESSAPILLGLGYAITVNMGDSGKFGAEDSTADFFVSSVCYDWNLKHLKLVALHSINHALCKERQRRSILKRWNEQWNKWVCEFTHHAPRQEIPSLKRLDIFTRTNNWQYSQKDRIAEKKFEELRQREISRLPGDFFGKITLTHLEHMRSSLFYDVLKGMPKGVVHHLHIDCTEDEDFYRQHIITDPNIYLSNDRKGFKIGTAEEAKAEGWISFAELEQQFPNRLKMAKFVSNLTMLSRPELLARAGEQHQFWVLFEEKISNFFPLVFTLHIFKKYMRHVLLKYIRNGYDRIEFRALLTQLTQYDEKGNKVKVHNEGKYMEAFDEVYQEVVKEHPNFTVGFIFFGLKALSQEENFKMLDKACSYEWPRTIGIDFVQQEDPYGSMQPYIRVGNAIVKKYAHLNLKKVYHAGETKDHTNNNVELSVRSGAVRIGHGLNIIKRIDYLNMCRHICFELNPISNLCTGGMTDIRHSTAPLLLGMGYAVSISSDDPGKFGYEDSTVDFFASAVSFNWTLRHFKLIAYHSINHAIVTEGQRLKLLESFNSRWGEWIDEFLEKQGSEVRWPKRQNQLREDAAAYQDMTRINFPIVAARVNSTVHHERDQ